MKLSHFRIQNFRSILDSGKVSVGDLCCLVGKNEAGKTAALTALQSIHPFGKAQSSFDITEDYPRRFATAYEDRHPDHDAMAVETWWEMSEEGYKILCEEFGEESITSREFRIYRRYQNSTKWAIPINEKAAIANGISTLRLNAAEQSIVANSSSSAELIRTISEHQNRTDKLNTLLERFSGFRNQSVFCRGIDLIKDLVPTFFYTSHYDRMSGQLSALKLAQDQKNNGILPEDKIFLDFLRLAGTDLNALNESPRYEELNAKCEAASAQITDQIFEYWSQNEFLTVQVELNEGRPKDPPPFDQGVVARARVFNQLHRASVPFSERSAGFVWFFSFLVQFTMMRRTTKNVIILLDEPGLTLHGKAQEDLLRYIQEKLLPAHQVIYSTHSLFMVPPKRLADCRIVEDVVKFNEKGRKPQSGGTKITEDVMSTDRDTLFPLQGALGHSVTQSLFIGENSLLVEGPSDILYLQVFSNELERRRRVGLDAKWTLCPAGGIDNLRPFISLFYGNHLNVAVLSDQGQGTKSKIERIRRSEILAAENLYTIAELLGQDEADIEDLMHPAFFCRIVNEAYELKGKDMMTEEELAAAEGAPRQVKQAEAYFRLLPPNYSEFSHYRPANWLMRNSGILEGEDDEVSETLDRAEKVFKVYNKILG